MDLPKIVGVVQVGNSRVIDRRNLYTHDGKLEYFVLTKSAKFATGVIAHFKFKFFPGGIGPDNTLVADLVVIGGAHRELFDEVELNEYAGRNMGRYGVGSQVFNRKN